MDKISSLCWETDNFWQILFSFGIQCYEVWMCFSFDSFAHQTWQSVSVCPERLLERYVDRLHFCSFPSFRFFVKRFNEVVIGTWWFLGRVDEIIVVNCDVSFLSVFSNCDGIRGSCVKQFKFKGDFKYRFRKDSEQHNNRKSRDFLNYFV